MRFLKRALIGMAVLLLCTSGVLGEEYVGTRAELIGVLRSALGAGTTRVTLTGPAADADTVQSAMDVIPEVKGWSCGTSATDLQLYMELHAGAGIVAALRRGETLSDDHAELYERAKAVLSDVLTDGMTELEKERAIYDRLCDMCTYALDETMGTESAEGVLRYGRAQCSGYADAFYLLGTMAGLEVTCVCGTATESGESHEWNLVRLGGMWYYVDATWGDTSDNVTLRYATLNLPVELTKAFLSWDGEALPVLLYASVPDEKNPIYASGGYVRSDDEAYAYAKAQLERVGHATMIAPGRLDCAKLAERLQTDVQWTESGLNCDGFTAVYFDTDIKRSFPWN